MDQEGRLTLAEMLRLQEQRGDDSSGVYDVVVTCRNGGERIPEKIPKGTPISARTIKCSRCGCIWVAIK